MTRLAVVLVPVIFAYSLGCGRVTTVSESQVKEKIDAQLGVGSSLTQVISFLNSFEVRGRKPIYNSYPSERLSSIDATRDPRLKSYIRATLKNTGRDDGKFLVYRIEITFFFDKDERLVDYSTKTYGDW